MDRAQDFVFAVTGSIRRRVTAAGTDAWNYGPLHRQARERSAGLLARAVNRVDREAAALHRAGMPEGVTRTRLRDRAGDRAARERAARNPHPLGRATR